MLYSNDGPLVGEDIMLALFVYKLYHTNDGHDGSALEYAASSQTLMRGHVKALEQVSSNSSGRPSNFEILPFFNDLMAYSGFTSLKGRSSCFAR